MSNQEEVDIFMNQYGLSIKPEFRALDVAAEFGEVATKILSLTNYGDEVLQKNEKLEKEMGDLYFSLIALANRINVDLDIALDKALDKYKERLGESGSPASKPKQMQEADPE